MKMYVVKMEGQFQAIFATEGDAWKFANARKALFPERAVDVLYCNDQALIDLCAAA